MNTDEKPNCYKCVHRLEVAGSCHSRCNNHDAKVSAHAHGIRNGWFIWPLNFDPVWLETCDGFSDKQEDKAPRKEANPLAEIMAIMR